MSFKHLFLLGSMSMLGYLLNINLSAVLFAYLVYLDFNFDIIKKRKTKRSEIKF